MDATPKSTRCTSRRSKYWTLVITSCLLLAHTQSLPADTYTAVECEEVYSTDVGGCGYQACRNCPVLAPAVALAVVALAGIIAVALQTDHTHAHSHHHGCHKHRSRCCN